MLPSTLDPRLWTSQHELIFGISVVNNSWIADNFVDGCSADGIKFTGNNNRVERNTVINSLSGYRLGFSPTTNFVVQNVSQRNGSSYLFTVGSIIGGPIVTVSSNVTTTSPWVNFSVP